MPTYTIGIVAADTLLILDRGFVLPVTGEPRIYRELSSRRLRLEEF